jgi:hypothetical protein
MIVERIMRDREGIWRQVVSEQDLGRMTLSMLITSVASLAIYGAVLGASHSFAQAASSAIKLPLLFLATLAICLPTLYLFNLIFGARLTMMQAITLIMTCITVMSVLALAFAPISLFFLISADNYEFLKLLNVAILILSALVGLRFLTSGMAALNNYQQQQAALEQAAAAPAAHEAPVTLAFDAGADGAESISAANSGGGGAVAVLPAAPPLPARAGQLAVRVPEQGFGPPPARPASMTLLYIWILLFGFVGTQLAWTLRPFFGSPGEPFQVFRHLEGTFYEDIFKTIGNLFN